MNTKILKGLLISATILGVGVINIEGYAEEIVEPIEEVIETMEQTEQVEAIDVIEATAEVEPAQEQEQQIVDENTQEATEDVIEEQATEPTLVTEEKVATPMDETPKDIIEKKEQTANDIKNEIKYGVSEAGNYYLKTTGTGKIHVCVGLKEYITSEGYVGDSSAVYVLYVEDGKILNQDLYELLMAEDAYILAEDGVTVELIKVETVVEENEDNSTKEEATEPIDQPNDVDVLEEQAQDTTDEQQPLHSVNNEEEALAPKTNEKEANSWNDITKNEKVDIQEETNTVENSKEENISESSKESKTQEIKENNELPKTGASLVNSMFAFLSLGLSGILTAVLKFRK